jgi:O-acetyl-ADP-ribose deacetylase (regulator of RNase III)
MFFERIRDIVKDIRDIITAPTINISILLGFLSVLLSFCRYDKGEGLSFVSDPAWGLFGFGCLLVFASFAIFWTRRKDVKHDVNAAIGQGVTLRFDKLELKLKLGRIEDDYDKSEKSAVALPCNTSFVDDCISDRNSALGAFVLKHYPDRMPDVKKAIEELTMRSGIPKGEDGTYPPGTTIIMPREYNTPAKVLITASTVTKERVGIRAQPSTICECIKQIFEVTADKKVCNVSIPVLGSGHGGVDINDALLFMVLAIKHYSRHYHHLASISIIFTEHDTQRIEKNRLQYLSLLGVSGTTTSFLQKGLSDLLFVMQYILCCSVQHHFPHLEDIAPI